MAKKKGGPRQDYGLRCGDCGHFNYITSRNKVNTPEKLKLTKYCRWCRKRTAHKETSKLK
jgi:large subunit ribosomal protein L33